jgi:hypothetical protein
MYRSGFHVDNTAIILHNLSFALNGERLSFLTFDHPLPVEVKWNVRYDNVL